MVFLIETNGYQKMCDTNENVTKMGMLIKGFTIVAILSLATWCEGEGTLRMVAMLDKDSILIIIPHSISKTNKTKMLDISS